MAGCDLPGVGAVCDTVSGAVGGLAGDAAGSVFDAAAQKIAEGFATATQMVVTFWTGVEVPGLDASSGPVAELRANTAWLTAWIAALSVLVSAGRLALTRSSRPAGEALKGLLILVVVSGCGVAAVNALVVFGDEYSRWVLDRSTDGQLGHRMAQFATLGGVPGLGSGLLLLVGLLGMLASLVQMGLMLVRVGVVTIFAGLLPLAAAGTGTETGMAWFKRIVSWLLAFVLYKPAAATVYASAFLLIGDGTDATSVLSGLFMLILSIVALPSLLRLITPMVGTAVAAGAGAGGGAAAAGLVLASGARMTAGAGPAGRTEPQTAGGSAGLLPGGAGPAASPARGGAASGGAGAAGVQAGVQLASSTASAARGAASGSAAGLDTPPAAPRTAGPSGSAAVGTAR
jgi:type IV secretion system protein TrbL